MAVSEEAQLQKTRREAAGKSPRPAPTKSAELRARLDAAEERLQHHVRSLRREMTLRDVNVAHAPMLDYVRWHPVLSIGIAAGATALATLAVSLLRRSRPEADEKVQWTRAMIKDLLDDAAARIGPDGDGEAALRRALRRRAPIILIEVPPKTDRDGGRGPVAGLLLTAAKAALGFGGKLALDFATKELTAKSENTSRLQDREATPPA